MFCPQCGGSIPKGATFCPSCGSQVTPVSSPPPVTPSPPPQMQRPPPIQPPQAPVPMQRQQPPPQPLYQTAQARPKKSGSNWALFCCLFLIVIIAVGSFAVISFLPLLPIFGMPRVLATESYAVAMDNDTIGIDLDIEMIVGPITMIIGESSMTNLVDIQQEVWTSNRSLTYNPSLIATFDETNAANVTTVSFDAHSGYYQYYYDLEITVHPSVAIGLQVVIGVGSLTWITSDDLTLRNLDVLTGTGSIELDLQGTTLLEFASGKLTTGTGSIDFSSANLNMTQDSILDLNTGTGSIDISLDQTLDFNQTLFMDVDTGTGSIDALVDYSNAIGLNVTTDTNTGSIDVSGLTSGLSTNYASVGTHIDFDLRTTTGSIELDATLT